MVNCWQLQGLFLIPKRMSPTVHESIMCFRTYHKKESLQGKKRNDVLKWVHLSTSLPTESTKHIEEMNMLHCHLFHHHKIMITSIRVAKKLCILGTPSNT